MTRMNRLLKLLCAVLVLCGLLCCAGSAGAEGDVASVTVGTTTTAYSSLDEALAAAQASNGATLTLLQNVDGEVTVTSGSFTLDLNGCTITGTNQSAVTVSNSAVCLAIVDSKGTGGLTGPHGVYLSAADEVNLRGIRITATGNDHSGVQIESGESSTVNIIGCTINSAYAGVTSGVSNEKINGAVVNISGGTSITVSVDTIGTAVSAYEGALTITGGSYTGGILVLTTKADISGATITESRDSFNAVDVWSSAEVTFTDCTISATGAEIAGVSVSGKSTATIASGTITGTSYGVRNYDGNTTITGGRISGGTADLYNRSSMTLAIADGQTEGATFPGGFTVAGGALADMLDDSVTCWVVLDGRDTMLLASGEYAYGETGVTGMGDVTIRAICDHADIVPEYIIRDTTHTLSCPVCSWAQGDTESHSFTENSHCTCGAVCAHVFADGACTTCGLAGGYCGASANEGGEQSVTWTLADNHLVISGTGAMADSFYEDLPWWDSYQTITDVTIGEGVTRIGEHAFYNFQSLTEITIPASVESIGYEAFRSSTVSSVTFAPNSRLTTIDDYAFNYLVSLKQITLPASVESIGDGAFACCDALETVTIAEGSRLSSLGYMPFSDCYSLTAISIPESATACKTIDGVLYSGDGTTLLLYPAGKTDEAFTTPAGVTTIAESALLSAQFRTVTLSEGVTTIGNSAFYGCNRMQSVSLPSTLTSIVDSAFANCNGLTTITIPASVSSIGSNAFASCYGLTTVTIPASVTSIGGDAFRSCYELTTVNAPCSWDGSLYTFADTVTVNVPAHAFADGVCTGCGADCEHPGYEDGVCTQCGAICAHTFGGGACTTCGLTGGYCGASTNEGGEQSVTWTLADNHLVISGTGAMADYSSSGWPWDDASKTITDVTIGEGVTHIGKHAFYNFRSLTEITIPASVEAIGYSVFENSTVSSVTFAPNSRLTTIDDYAFSYLLSLKQITLPASVETIGDRVFETCTALETVTFAEGSRLSSLGYTPFICCYSLTAISIPESVTAYKTIDGVLYSGDGTTLLLYPEGKTDEAFTTPAGVTTIAEGALSSARFRTFILSEEVTTIGDSAFSGCSSLQSVSLPSTLTSIGDSMFFHCDGLTTVTIPASVTSIGNSAFESCNSLTEVTIPASVTSIGGNAFAFCSNLTTVTLPASVTSIGDSAFSYCDGLTTVNAPCNWDGSLYTFEDTVTVNVADHIFVDGVCTACGVTGGYCGASTNAGGEQSVVWTYRDGKLTIRGEGAMADFGSGDIPWSSYKASITSLTIAEGVTSISKKAFSGSGITRITIPASVDSVGMLAFQDCSGLAIVEFADGSRLTTIDSHAFAYCTALMQITVPASVSSLDSAAFVGCEQLTDIVVASGNTTYQAMEGVLYRDNGTTLLYYPMGRTEAEFSTPEGVTSISADAFRDAVHLETLNMTFVTYLDAQAFGHNETLSTVVIPPTLNSIDSLTFSNCAMLTTVHVPCNWKTEPLCEFNDTVTVDIPGHDYGNDGICTVCDYAAKAKVGDTYYDTLPDAFEAAEENDRVDLLADCDEDIWVASECFFYGGSYTCSGAVTNYGYIYDGIFTGNVNNSKYIYGGTFDGEVTNNGDIWGGVFNGAVTNNLNIENLQIFNYTFAIGDDFVIINNGTIACDQHFDPTVANCEHGETCRLCGEYGEPDPANHTYASNVCCGAYGENLTWMLTDGVLAVTGTGEMPASASASDIPWYGVRETITSVQLPDSLETIDSYAFDGCSAMTSINIPLSVTYIGNGAFNGCTALTTVNVPCTWKNSWLYAFENGDVLQIGDHQSIEIVWEWHEDSAYAYAYKHCTDCDTYPDSADGDAEVTETEAVDCAHPGSRVFTATLTFSDSTVVTGTHTVAIPSENHVGPMSNGFCTACNGFEKPDVDPGEYEDDTWDDTYLISNAGQLYWFAAEVNDGNNGINARLTKSISVPASVSKGGSIPDWTPIGTGYVSYTGSFSGGGCTVSGLYCNTSSNAGFFGATGYNYPLTNLGVTNSTFIGGDRAGAIAGYAESSISGCWASGNTIEGNYAGGLAGQNIGFIDGSRASSNTVEGDLAGGLVGYNNNGTITRSYATGSTVTGDSAGGLIGENYGTIENCYCTGNSAGYLVDYNGDPITNCFTDGSALFGDSYGDVTNSYYVSSAANDDGGRTSEQFASGEIAYLLQSAIEPEEVYDEETGEWVMADAPLVWGQSIGSASFPTLGSKRVYQVLSCDGESTAYSNSDEPLPHSYKDSVCVNCGVTGGYCGAEGDGSNILWTLKDGTLTITGSGAMNDYEYAAAPWFSDRYSITSLNITAGVTNIGDFAFTGCCITEVVIPASAESVGDSAFMGCHDLERVSFAEGSRLTTIVDGAFQSCFDLMQITLPAGVTAIGDLAFSGCNSLTDIFVAEGNEVYKDIDGVLYSADGTILLIYPTGKTEDTFTTPEGVKIIADSACNGASFSKVILSDGVTSIGDLAFSSNLNLLEVTIPASVTSISSSFLACDSLTTVNAPCNWDGSLYTFKDTVTVNVPDHAFTDGICDGCGIACPHDTGNGNACGICGATVNRKLMTLPAALTVIEAEAFSGTAAQAIAIPAKCTTIETGAFTGCGSLEAVIFASADCTIANGAIPSGVTIVAPAGGTVEAWAEANGISFQAQ